MDFKELKKQLEDIHKYRFDENTVGDITNTLISTVDEEIAKERVQEYQTETHNLIKKSLGL